MLHLVGLGVPDSPSQGLSVSPTQKEEEEARGLEVRARGRRAEPGVVGATDTTWGSACATRAQVITVLSFQRSSWGSKMGQAQMPKGSVLHLAPASDG